MAPIPRARSARAVAGLVRRFSRCCFEGLEPRTLLANVPAGFTDAQVAAGLNNPTAMALAPDGRIFVAEKNGAVRIIKNNQLLSQPFATVSVDTFAMRGLGGIVLDPNFASNGYVYVYYTANQPSVHNRIARFTANGDVAQSNSLTLLLALPDVGSAHNHMGGGMVFGNDGKLYVAIGDHDRGNDANTLQSLSNVWGKMLRINPNGTIPTDNPFYNQTSGINRAIWAYGLRNPFTAAVQPGTGRIFINDVGELSWEEINDGIAGANYGWPLSEGPTSNPSFVAPFHAYPTSQGCAITGGDFYNPATSQFPAEYQGKYFFADNCGGWIRVLDLNTRQATTFATAVNQPVDLDVSADGTLYYLQRGNGSVRKVTYATAAPTITQHPSSQTVDTGQPATFTVAATGGSLNYQWQRRSAGSANFANVGTNSPSYTINSTTSGDHNAQFRVVVSNSGGSVTSNTATLTVLTEPAAQVYLSDMNPTFATNGWGPYERDMSNGEQNAGDGGPITLNGVVYPKGLGVHAYSELRFNLAGGNFTRFVSDVGVDDYVGNAGSVVFQVWTDGTKIFDSGTMTGASATQTVDVNVAGRSELRLIVTDAGNGNASDHADWAGARLLRTLAAPAVSQSTFHYATAPHRLAFQFNTNVSASLGVADLVLANLTTNSTVPAGNIALSYNGATDTATFTFPGYTNGVLPDGRYRATLVASGITNPNGTPMSANHVYNFTFLRGDANGDGQVNLSDFNILAANFGQTGRNFTQGDFNYDGIVNLQDFNILAARFGMVLGASSNASMAGESDRDEDDHPGPLESPSL